MNILHVQLLGDFRLILGDTPLPSLKTPRLQALLAYLVLNHGKPLFRYEIAYTFWPQSSESQARTNLRNLFHLLRQSLTGVDQYIQADDQTLLWREDAPYTLDVTQFLQQLAVRPTGHFIRESLERAVDLYKGDLLPSCYDDWIIPERERLRQSFIAALEGLAEVSEDERDYPAALHHAFRLVQADPLHAKGNHQLVRLHSLLGERAAALKAYQVYAHRLQRELGVEPDSDLQKLYTRLQQTRETAFEPALPGVFPLVGRNREWHQLRNLCLKINQANPQVVFITGEAGIGKTRLVEELSGWATRQGITTLLAVCYPAEGRLPYAPVVSWLRGRPLPELEKVWLAEVARLLPEIAQKHPRLKTSDPSNGEWQRQRLFEALQRALLTKQQAVILVLEDIHWCDQDTLEWLHFLLRSSSPAHFLVLATQRSGEIEPDHPLLTLEAALRAEGKSTTLELTPLTEAETLALARQATGDATGQQLQPETVDQILRQAEGNPLFIIEMVRLGQSLSPNRDSNPNWLTGSEKIRSVLQRRMHLLSQPAREVTCFAAVIGQEFDLDLLRIYGGEGEEKLVAALDEMIERHIIREISPAVYDFTHDRLRQTALLELSTAHLRLLHRRAAEAYLNLDEASVNPRHAVIASHYENAGLPLLAVRHYQLAAQAAREVFANADAQLYFQKAVELVDSLKLEAEKGFPASEFAGLLEEWGDSLALNGRHSQAQESYERALAQPFTSPAIWRSQVYRKISDILVPQYQHAQAHAVLDQAELALSLPDGGGTGPERLEWFQVQLARCQMFYWDNHPEKIEALLEKIGPLIEAEGSLSQRIELMMHEIMFRLRQERYRISLETVTLARRRLELSEALDDPFQLEMAYFQLGFSLLWHGNPLEAIPWLDKSTAGFERTGPKIWLLRCLAYQGIANRQLGNLERAQDYTRRLVQMTNEIYEPTYLGMAQANQGWVAWKQGNLTDAEQCCRMALETWNTFGGSVFHALADWVLLAVAVAQGDLAMAEQAAQALAADNPTNQPILEPMLGELNQALTALQAKDESAAWDQFNLALEHAQAAKEL